MTRITGPDLSPHSPQTSADDPAFVHDLDDSIRYVSPASRVRESMMMRLMRESGINVT